MHPVFADTFYFLALLNTKDAGTGPRWKPRANRGGVL